MTKPATLEACLELVRAASEASGEALVYRGEASIYPVTNSSHHRLFSVSNRFSEGQARAVKERLLTIAQMLDVVGLARVGFANEAEALRHTVPASLDEINQVVYCFMQHYHLPTPFIDLTKDLEIAAAFAAFGAKAMDASSRRTGAIYVVSAAALRRRGYWISDASGSSTQRPRKQKAVSLFLPRGEDFQTISDCGLLRFEFEDSAGAVGAYDDQELYDASGDRIAREVATLAYRCAFEDLASRDPSHGRVTEFFAEIAYRLADAGAVPTSG